MRPATTARIAVASSSNAPLLGEIPDCAGVEHPPDGRGVGQGRQCDDPGAGGLGDDLAGGVDAVEVGQADVHHHHVRTQLRRQPDRGPAVLRLGHDGEVVLALEQGTQALADDPVVVGQEHAASRGWGSGASARARASAASRRSASTPVIAAAIPFGREDEVRMPRADRGRRHVRVRGGRRVLGDDRPARLADGPAPRRRVPAEAGEDDARPPASRRPRRPTGASGRRSVARGPARGAATRRSDRSTVMCTPGGQT